MRVPGYDLSVCFLRLLTTQLVSIFYLALPLQGETECLEKLLKPRILISRGQRVKLDSDNTYHHGISITPNEFNGISGRCHLDVL